MSERFTRTKSRIVQPFTPVRFTVEAGLSLCRESPTNPSVRRKELYEKLALTSTKEPLNREEDLYTKFLSVLDSRNISPNKILQTKTPYWNESAPYNKMEVVGTCIQFTDEHGAPLPKATLPPTQDLETFINRILQEPQSVTVDRQFAQLLDITDNDVVGAANLGMMATRYMSRFADHRAYPSVKIGDKEYTKQTEDTAVEEILGQWNTKIAKFETYSNSDLNDGLGDNYYFWTHLFATLVLYGGGLKGKAMGSIFGRGTELMIFAQYKIAGRHGQILPHFEASKLGRAIGLSLIEQAKP